MDADNAGESQVNLYSPYVIPPNDVGENLIFDLEKDEIVFVMNGGSTSGLMKNKGKLYQLNEDDDPQKIPEELSQVVLAAEA